MILNMKKTIILFAIIFSSANAFAFPQAFNVRGGAAGDNAGSAIACIGPTNANSVGSDVIIGTPNSSNGGDVKIFNGLTGQSLQTLSSTLTGERFGFSVAGLGDIDGDTFHDFVIGAPGTMSTPGHVYVYSTQAGTFNQLLFSASFPGSQTGFSVAGLFSDLNSDSINDLIFGSPTSDLSPSSPGSNEGSVTVYSPTGTFPLLNFNGLAGDNLGFSVDSIQDLDSDGKRDIIAGAPKAAGGTGKVVVFSTQGSGSIVSVFSGSVAGAEFGTSISALGDINGDSIEDIIIGAPKDSTNGTEAGSVTVIGLNSQTICVLNGQTPSGNFGQVVKFLGDINGDSRIDFMVTEPGFTNSPGRVFIFSYDQGINSCVPLPPILGTNVGEQLGISATGGTGTNCDFNSDGLTDFGIGSNDDTNGANSGAATFFFGEIPFIPPTSSQLSFRIAPNGDFLLRNQYNLDPSGNCNITVYGRSTDANGQNRGPIKRFVNRANAQFNTRFRANALSLVEKTPSMTPFVYHMIAVTKCGAQTFHSNVFARKLTCGREPKLLINEWENQLKSRLQIVSGAKR